MKPWLAVLFLMLMTVAALAAADDDWMTDHAKALQKAQAEKKTLLILFTGSTWCPMCIQLEKEVFRTKKFMDYAARNLVLLKVDFPAEKDQRVESKIKLAEQYGIDEDGGIQFPTMVILTPSGKKTVKIGYEGQDPSAFVGELKELKK